MDLDDSDGVYDLHGDDGRGENIMLGTNNYMRRAETRTQLLQGSSQQSQYTQSSLTRPILNTEPSAIRFKKSGKRSTVGFAVAN